MLDQRLACARHFNNDQVGCGGRAKGLNSGSRPAHIDFDMGFQHPAVLNGRLQNAHHVCRLAKCLYGYARKRRDMGNRVFRHIGRLRVLLLLHGGKFQSVAKTADIGVGQRP